MRKQIAGALVASVLMASVPAWAETPQQQFRASVDRAVDGQVAGQPLTAAERADLEARRAILKTDPVARGAGGIFMSLVATAVSIGLTIYLLKKTKESTPAPSMGRP